MRIFLASPKDVANYREAVKRVAERLNQQHGSKLGSDPFLEIVDWNAHVAPLQSLPESAMVEEIEVDPKDVFVGIAWLGFDSQTADGDGEVLSTERNFEIAFNFWKGREPARCFLYRGMRLPDRLTDIDGKAFHRVTQFFSRFRLDGENPVPYYEFTTATDLEEHLASQLSALLDRLAGRPRPAPVPPASTARPAPPPRPPAEPAEPEAEFASKMQPGQAYEVSFLRVGMVESEPLVEARKGRPLDFEVLCQSFRKLVTGTAAVYGGEVFSWNVVSGLVIFWRPRSYDHAIMTGLKVLHNLPVFNLDSTQNPIAANVKMRAAAHDAVIIFQQPVSSIHSEDLDFVVELERENTEPGELSITRRLLDRIDGRLKPHFKYKGRFGKEPVYVCQLPSAERVPSQEGLDDLRKRLSGHTSKVREALSVAPASLDAARLESLSTAVDGAYSVLNKFCVTYSNLDGDWPPEFLRELAGVAADVTREEAEIWGALRQCYVSGKLPAGRAQKLEAVVRSASRRRSRPVVILGKLEQRCRQLLADRAVAGGAAGAEPTLGRAPSGAAAGGRAASREAAADRSAAGGAATGDAEPTASETEDLAGDLVKKLDVFVKADALDSEVTLTELLLNRKGEFLTYLQTQSSEDRHRLLVDKLWETVDLVLLDDLYSIRGRQRADETKVFDVLVSEPLADARFATVRSLLEEEVPSPEEIPRVLAEAGLRGDDDLQRIWRCLVLGHPVAEIRNAAAFQLSQDSMWQAISHPSIPIASIYSIGERVNTNENEDAKKIFFDCVRERLESAVESFQTRDEVSMLTKLILLLLDFSFLVETGYFERFDDILGKFLDRANEAGLKVEYFESLRKTLEEARKKSGDKGPSKPPAGLNKLPLTLQRRLAGEARYVYWFVTHPDQRIANETLRHVGLMNVERVLRLREVNKSVLAAILRKAELFTRPQAIVTALNHPKCDQQFAGRHVPTLARSRGGLAELNKIASNPSANPVIRSAAQRAVRDSRRGR